MGDRPTGFTARSTRARTPRQFPSQDDEALRRARQADTTPTAAVQMAGALVGFVELINAIAASTPGAPTATMTFQVPGHPPVTADVTEAAALSLSAAIYPATRMAREAADDMARRPEPEPRPTLRLIPTGGAA